VLLVSDFMAWAAFAASFGLSAWIAAPLTVAGLSISSLPTYIALWPRARHAGTEAEWWKTVLLSRCSTISPPLAPPFSSAVSAIGCGSDPRALPTLSCARWLNRQPTATISGVSVA
jgi:hypothetical protein